MRDGNTSTAGRQPPGRAHRVRRISRPMDVWIGAMERNWPTTPPVGAEHGEWSLFVRNCVNGASAAREEGIALHRISGAGAVLLYRNGTRACMELRMVRSTCPGSFAGRRRFAFVNPPNAPERGVFSDSPGASSIMARTLLKENGPSADGRDPGCVHGGVICWF
jgi:hypothetical protein